MAKKLTSSINQSIFYALKNSETSKVPVLLIGSAGTGKSTTVEMFAELRGYELLLLRGSTASEQEIMGFMSVHQSEKEVVATQVLPTWYLKMKEYHEAGKKTLLFLDEITAVNPYVQAALLHLIFERKVNEEKIPEDTLIVSAGNYSGNLTNEFELLSPVVNRFCVYNITPDESSLDEFLKVYDGAGIGKKRNIMKEKEELLAKMDKEKVDLTDDLRDRVGYYFETAIRETTRSLMGGEKKLDFKCTDTQSLYKAQEGDEILRGFVSLRTLSYLTRFTIAAYENFGEGGIKGKNFRCVLEGLVGIALSRKEGDVVASKVAEVYHQSLIQTLSSIGKLSNPKIRVYEEFFNNMIIEKKARTELETSEVTIILDKLQEMSNDVELQGISKPLEDDVIKKISELIKFSANKALQLKIATAQDVSSVLTPEVVSGIIGKWNPLATLYLKVNGLVRDPKNSYAQDIINSLDTLKSDITPFYMKINSYCRLASRNNPEFTGLMPELKSIENEKA